MDGININFCVHTDGKVYPRQYVKNKIKCVKNSFALYLQSKIETGGKNYEHTKIITTNTKMKLGKIFMVFDFNNEHFDIS